MTNPAIPADAVELLPCPFCNGPVQPRWALWPSDGDADAIIHAAPSDCGLTEFSIGTSDKGAIAAWNRRAALSAEPRPSPAARPEGDVPWHDISQAAKAAIQLKNAQLAHLRDVMDAVCELSTDLVIRNLARAALDHPTPASYLSSIDVKPEPLHRVDANLSAALAANTELATQLAEIKAERDDWMKACRIAGICMSCATGSFEPCTDCLDTGWDGGAPKGYVIEPALNAEPGWREALVEPLLLAHDRMADLEGVRNDDLFAILQAAGALATPASAPPVPEQACERCGGTRIDPEHVGHDPREPSACTACGTGRTRSAEAE